MWLLHYCGHLLLWQAVRRGQTLLLWHDNTDRGYRCRMTINTGGGCELWAPTKQIISLLCLVCQYWILMININVIYVNLLQNIKSWCKSLCRWSLSQTEGSSRKISPNLQIVGTGRNCPAWLEGPAAALRPGRVKHRFRLRDLISSSLLTTLLTTQTGTLPELCRFSQIKWKNAKEGTTVSLIY